MFAALKRLFAKPSKPSTKEEKVALQPPGVMFPWPRLTPLTALEELSLCVPAAILESSDVIGSVIKCDPDLELRLPSKPGDPHIFMRLKAGMSVHLTKSCQAMVVADDKRPRRIQVGNPPA